MLMITQMLRSCSLLHSHVPAHITSVAHTSTATAVGGRGGHVSNSDKVVDVKLSLPTGLGGKGVQAGTTTPEDLFAAGYAACFGGAAELMAKTLKIAPSKLAIKADVSVGRTESKSLALAVVLTGHFAGVTEQQAKQVMEAAHSVCPYSHATRDNIEVTLKTVIEKQ